MKKTWNIWVYNKEAKGPTGPWQFGCAVLAKDEGEAMEIARSRFGLNDKYMVYEG